MVQFKFRKAEGVCLDKLKSQFHYGSIQIKNGNKKKIKNPFSLNSTMVQFKWHIPLPLLNRFPFVSIPLWFNSNPSEGGRGLFGKTEVSIPLWFNSNTHSQIWNITIQDTSQFHYGSIQIIFI